MPVDAATPGAAMLVAATPDAGMQAEAMLDVVTPVADSMAARFGVVAASMAEAASTVAADMVAVDTANVSSFIF
jgi:hypothetical protein